MTPARFNRRVQAQLRRLLREGVIDACSYQQLMDRYPIGRWDWSALGRWFAVFGAVSLAAGLVLFSRELFVFTLFKLAWSLGLLTAALLLTGYRLRRSKFKWTKLSLELCAGFSLIGLTFTLGYLYSSGSGNWPALLLLDLLVLLPLAYLLHNVLLLILTAIVFFAWFGGFSGYSSAWHGYWFGMNYPLRFLFAALAMILAALAHRLGERSLLSGYRDFYKVWLSSGVYFAEMALWLLSLFGNFNIAEHWRSNSVGELWLFNLLWAGGNIALLALGTRYLLRMLRGYAVTFLIIQGYTLFFWHIAERLGMVLSTAVAGLTALALVMYLEKRHRT